MNRRKFITALGLAAAAPKVLQSALTNKPKEVHIPLQRGIKFPVDEEPLRFIPEHTHQLPQNVPPSHTHSIPTQINGKTYYIPLGQF